MRQPYDVEGSLAIGLADALLAGTRQTMCTIRSSIARFAFALILAGAIVGCGPYGPTATPSGTIVCITTPCP
jgi:hypothetical protein